LAFESKLNAGDKKMDSCFRRNDIQLHVIPAQAGIQVLHFSDQNRHPLDREGKNKNFQQVPYVLRKGTARRR